MDDEPENLEEEVYEEMIIEEQNEEYAELIVENIENEEEEYHVESLDLTIYNNSNYNSNYNSNIASRLYNVFQNNHFTNPNMNNTNSNTSLDAILNTSFYDKPKYKNVLSERGCGQLILINYEESLGINSYCPIEQTQFTDKMQVIQLPCKHCFCKNAIQKWLNEECAQCPICRFKLDSKEIENDDNSDDITNNNITNNNILDLIEETIDQLLDEQNAEQLQMAIINSIQEST